MCKLNVAGTVRVGNDVLGVINTNWLTPKNAREIKVTGEKGMFAADYLTQELYFYENEFERRGLDYNSGFVNVVGGAVKIKIENKEPLKNELEAFVGCIRKDKTVSTTGKDGLDVLYVAQNLMDSSKENEVVAL